MKRIVVAWMMMACMPIAAAQQSDAFDWVTPESVAPPVMRKELTPDQTLAIAQIQRQLMDVDTLPLEEWLEGFRRDENPDREIAIWQRLAQVYTEFLRDRDTTLEYKKEVFKILIACTMMPREEVPKNTGVKLLTAREIIHLMDGFYGADGI